MSSRGGLLMVLCAAMVMAAGALVGFGAGVAAGAGSASSSECSTVTVDAFRVSNSTISEINQTGSATVSTQNVEVTVEETDGFVRVRSANPNGYCVRVSVEISSELVAPAELGNVDAVKPSGSSITADWSAMHSLQDNESYTEVTFELPAGSPSVLFAPSKLRVETLSWTGTAETKANSTVSSIKETLGLAGDLQKNTYLLNGTQGDITTVSLRSKDGRQVQEWHALYKTKSGSWAPVGEETDSPVFYTEEEETVKFHYNNKTTVKFVANPGITESTSYQMKSYSRSVNDILDFKLPFMLLPPAEVSA